MALLCQQKYCFCLIGKSDLQTYKEFLSRNQSQGFYGTQRLMSIDDINYMKWNEAVVHKFKPIGMYVHDKSQFNDALLQKAQEDGSFVLVLKR